MEPEPRPVAHESTRPKRPAGPPILVPAALLVVATVLIRWFDVDLRSARLAFDGQGAWRLGDHWFVQFLYHYGTWPAIIAACVAGVVWIGSAFHDRWRPHRKLAIFVGLAIALGPGVMVNTLFKGFYGRPRPAEVIEFGGHREFAPVWEPHIGKGGRSFPSGHAAMGFFWISLAVYYSQRNRRLALGFALMALVQGGCMGFGRVVQGGHWVSDIVWAAGMVYLVVWFLYRQLRLHPAYSTPVIDDRSPPAP